MLQHFNPINQIQIFPKIAIRKLFFGLFYHPIPLFVIPHFSVILPLSCHTPLFCHTTFLSYPPYLSFWGCVSNRRIPSAFLSFWGTKCRRIPFFLSFWGSVSDRRIPSFYETLRAKALRETKKGHTASFLSFCPSYSVILRHEVPKNPLRSSFFSLKPAIREFLRFSSGQRLGGFTPSEWQRECHSDPERSEGEESPPFTKPGF